MFDSIKSALGIGQKTDYLPLIRQGAKIVDVRSKAEYSGGHIKGSINIPLDILEKNYSQLGDKNKPVITCCASGMRSAAAKNLLSKLGFTSVYNGGGWRSLQSKLN